jgi:flagellar hook-length control protein FliK
VTVISQALLTSRIAGSTPAPGLNPTEGDASAFLALLTQSLQGGDQIGAALAGLPARTDATGKDAAKEEGVPAGAAGPPQGGPPIPALTPAASPPDRPPGKAQAVAPPLLVLPAETPPGGVVNTVTGAEQPPSEAGTDVIAETGAAQAARADPKATAAPANAGPPQPEAAPAEKPVGKNEATGHVNWMEVSAMLAQLGQTLQTPLAASVGPNMPTDSDTAAQARPAPDNLTVGDVVVGAATVVAGTAMGSAVAAPATQDASAKLSGQTSQNAAANAPQPAAAPVATTTAGQPVTQSVMLTGPAARTESAQPAAVAASPAPAANARPETAAQPQVPATHPATTAPQQAAVVFPAVMPPSSTQPAAHVQAAPTAQAPRPTAAPDHPINTAGRPAQPVLPQPNSPQPATQESADNPVSAQMAIQASAGRPATTDDGVPSQPAKTGASVTTTTPATGNAAAQATFTSVAASGPAGSAAPQATVSTPHPNTPAPTAESGAQSPSPVTRDIATQANGTVGAPEQAASQPAAPPKTGARVTPAGVQPPAVASSSAPSIAQHVETAQTASQPAPNPPAPAPPTFQHSRPRPSETAPQQAAEQAAPTVSPQPPTQADARITRPPTAAQAQVGQPVSVQTMSQETASPQTVPQQAAQLSTPQAKSGTTAAQVHAAPQDTAFQTGQDSRTPIPHQAGQAAQGVQVEPPTAPVVQGTVAAPTARPDDKGPQAQTAPVAQRPANQAAPTDIERQVPAPVNTWGAHRQATPQPMPNGSARAAASTGGMIAHRPAVAEAIGVVRPAYQSISQAAAQSAPNPNPVQARPTVTAQVATARDGTTQTVTAHAVPAAIAAAPQTAQQPAQTQVAGAQVTTPQANTNGAAKITAPQVATTQANSLPPDHSRAAQHPFEAHVTAQVGPGRTINTAAVATAPMATATAARPAAAAPGTTTETHTTPAPVADAKTAAGSPLAAVPPVSAPITHAANLHASGAPADMQPASDRQSTTPAHDSPQTPTIHPAAAAVQAASTLANGQTSTDAGQPDGERRRKLDTDGKTVVNDKSAAGDKNAAISGVASSMRSATTGPTAPAQGATTFAAVNHAMAAAKDAAPEAARRQMIERLAQAASRGDQECHLELYPKELGRLEAHFSYTADKVSVSLRVETAGAHDALRQALPELRASLEARGVAIGQCNVSLTGGQAGSGGPWQGNTGTPSHLPGRFGQSSNLQASPVPQTPVMPARRQGMLDLVA